MALVQHHTDSSMKCKKNGVSAWCVFSYETDQASSELIFFYYLFFCSTAVVFFHSTSVHFCHVLVLAIRVVIIQEVCCRFSWSVSTEHRLCNQQTLIQILTHSTREGGHETEGIFWSEPISKQLGCRNIYHDAVGELQLTGGILHCAVSEFMYFTNFISLDWSYMILWSPNLPPLWNKFLLSCISETDNCFGAILVCAVVACIFSAASSLKRSLSAVLGGKASNGAEIQ